ncbi:uncharacterized protein LOC130648529 [Hydractinia symbiolongicarpus]|uniref:uncharacterized protein LOC130648529 n=1 Tax=Hydractinia symbiolongicarpus TaxID=13093 RepID=UPI00254C3240|nr:uncharacterized protein LOC130648529 [Hydractinia symbiolongicarpus]
MRHVAAPTKHFTYPLQSSTALASIILIKNAFTIITLLFHRFTLWVKNLGNVHTAPQLFKNSLDYEPQPNLVVESGIQPSLFNTCHHQIVYANVSFKAPLPPTYEREVWHYNRAQIHLIERSIENFDWVRAEKQDDEVNLRGNTDFVSELITDTKSSYFKNLGEKLNDPLIGTKTYWSILKRRMNKVKIPTVPSLLVDNIFVTDFKEKAGIFNVFFADQCNILVNGSTIPDINLKTDRRISSITFSSSDLSKIIKDLNPNKAHGHDNISIKMIQMCGNSIIFPLKLLFEAGIKSGCLPDTWKRGNIILIHKKGKKNIVKNYRPISLLPIFSKIFEKIIHNSLFRYFQENKLLSDQQSGFRRGDSCTSQLLAITHELYKSFDCNPSLETRGVFLDLFKAFDKWIFSRPLSTRINDFPENIVSVSKLFADDTSIFSTVYDITKSSIDLNNDLSTVKKWVFQWKMAFNPDPSKQATEKHLGLILDNKRSFDHHLRRYVRLTKSLLCIYKSFIRPHLDYADVIYDQPHNDSFCNKIESVQYNAALAITKAIRGTTRKRLYEEPGLESLTDRRWYHRLAFFFNIVSGTSPGYLGSFP